MVAVSRLVSCHVTPVVLSCLVLSCLVMSPRFIPCHVIFCHLFSRRVSSRYVMSLHSSRVMSRGRSPHVVSLVSYFMYHIVSSLLVLWHVLDRLISCHASSLYSWHVMSCYVSLLVSCDGLPCWVLSRFLSIFCWLCWFY